jgi:hypothetical protein
MSRPISLETLADSLSFNRALAHTSDGTPYVPACACDDRECPHCNTATSPLDRLPCRKPSTGRAQVRINDSRIYLPMCRQCAEWWESESAPTSATFSPNGEGVAR